MEQTWTWKAPYILAQWVPHVDDICPINLTDEGGFLSVEFVPIEFPAFWSVVIEHHWHLTSHKNLLYKSEKNLNYLNFFHLFFSCKFLLNAISTLSVQLKAYNIHFTATRLIEYKCLIALALAINCWMVQCYNEVSLEKPAVCVLFGTVKVEAFVYWSYTGVPEVTWGSGCTYLKGHLLLSLNFYRRQCLLKFLFVARLKCIVKQHDSLSIISNLS